MRAIFTLAGLVLVVAVIGVLASQQLKGGAAPAAQGAAPVPTASPQQQVQQFQQAVQGSMQQARPMPDNER